MKRIISDTFEQLEELGKTTAKQVAQQPKKMVGEATSVVTGKKTEKGIETPSSVAGQPTQVGQKTKKPKLTQAQIAQKISAADKSRSKLHLKELEEEMKRLGEERLEEIKKVQEEAFQKAEAVEPPEAQLPSKRKKGIMPISVKRLKQKVEGWRGAKG